MDEKKEFVKICHKIYKNNFVFAYDGNVSFKLEDNKFLATPSGKCKGKIRKKDLLIVDIDGNIIEGKGKTTSEWKMHKFVYLNRKDINCAIHCHPTFATAFAISRQKLNTKTSAEALLILGKVPLVDFFIPSTDEVSIVLQPYINKSDVFLLANHGALTLGKDLYDAYYKMEKLESHAKALFLSRLLGGEKNIDEEKISLFLSIAEKTYGIKPKI